MAMSPQLAWHELLGSPARCMRDFVITTTAPIQEEGGFYNFQVDPDFNQVVRCRFNAVADQRPEYYQVHTLGVPTTQVPAAQVANVAPTTFPTGAQAVITATLSGCSLGVRRVHENFEMVHIQPVAGENGNVVFDALKLLYPMVYGPRDYRLWGQTARATVIFINGRFYYQILADNQVRTSGALNSPP